AELLVRKPESSGRLELAVVDHDLRRNGHRDRPPEQLDRHLEALLPALDGGPRAGDPHKRMILGIEHRLAQHVAPGAGDVVGRRRAVELLRLLRAQRRIVDDELLDGDLHLEPGLVELGVHEDLPLELTDRDHVVVAEPLREGALALVDEPVDLGIRRVDLVELGPRGRPYLGRLRERETRGERDGNGTEPMDTHLDLLPPSWPWARRTPPGPEVYHAAVLRPRACGAAAGPDVFVDRVTFCEHAPRTLNRALKIRDLPPIRDRDWRPSAGNAWTSSTGTAVEGYKRNLVDVATLIGLIGALVTVAGAILMGGSAGAFVDGASVVIVVVGTLLVTLMKFSVAQFFGATKVAFKAFVSRVCDPEVLIDKSIELANH